MGQVRQWNGVKQPETWILDIKYVVRNQTDVVEHRNGVNIRKIWVLDLKECIKIFQVVRLESYYSETFNQIHTDTSFRNRSGASTKWRKTFENMSFGPKVLDWASSLLKNKNRFWRQELVHWMHLDTGFASIKECLELLVNFMNKILIHKTFKTITC